MLCLFDSLVQRKSPCLVQQRVWQSQSPSENPLRKRVPAVIDGRIASRSDSGREPNHTMQLFKHKFDADLIKQSTCVCFPDSSMPFTDCVLLWSNGCCRHGFAPQIFELLSELAFVFSSLVVIQPSRYAKRSDPVFEKWFHTIFGSAGCLHDLPIKQTNQWPPCHQTLCLCEVLPGDGVQDVADSRTHRIAAEVLRELQLRYHQ